jgi:hypothetical protein
LCIVGHKQVVCFYYFVLYLLARRLRYECCDLLQRIERLRRGLLLAFCQLTRFPFSVPVHYHLECLRLDFRRVLGSVFFHCQCQESLCLRIFFYRPSSSNISACVFSTRYREEVLFACFVVAHVARCPTSLRSVRIVA